MTETRSEEIEEHFTNKSDRCESKDKNEAEGNENVCKTNENNNAAVNDQVNSAVDEHITTQVGVEEAVEMETFFPPTESDLFTPTQVQENQQLSDAKTLYSEEMSTFCVDETSAEAFPAVVGVFMQSDCDEPPHPLSERWSPVGANYDDAMSPTSELLGPSLDLELTGDEQDLKKERHEHVELIRLRGIEDEQELLTSSLLALTSHFAHVQLRVRQIVEAPSHERDQLLKDLEEFAFKGIPESITPVVTPINKDAPTSGTPSPSDNAVAHQQQFELIDHLKLQLSELEKFAYESGAPVLPQYMLLEKQKIIIDELKQKLNLRVDDQDLPELSREELKNQVDHALGEFVGPLKMKDQLVAQLKTQISDLERFIAFLQCDADDSKLKTLSGNDKFNEAYNSYAAKKKKSISAGLQKSLQDEQTLRGSGGTGHRMRSQAMKANGADAVDGALKRNSDIGRPEEEDSQGQGVRESLNSKAHGLMDKASLLMQMFATTHFGSKAEHFQKNTLKKTSKGNHWGDLRAQLEVDIQEVASLAATLSFDREKLANMRRALKKSTDLSTAHHNGALTTAPLRGGCAPSTRCKQLKIYTLSSDSDEESAAYDSYDWEQTSRRLARQGGDSITTISKELTSAVRKNFAMTLLRLIQHGLRVETESATSSLIVPFMRCLNPSPVFASEHAYRPYAAHAAAASFMAAAPAHTAASYSAFGADDCTDGANDGGFFGSSGSRQMHAWELILEYYYLKHGDEYNNTPARKLSQSFNLEIVDSAAVTAKQGLLSTIGMIIAMHAPYKRSYNAHFKAFLCAALNSHQLVEWLNLIFSCNDLIDAYYTPNSYVVRTGFRDSLRSIETLSKYDFDLPVDLAVRHFKNI